MTEFCLISGCSRCSPIPNLLSIAAKGFLSSVVAIFAYNILFAGLFRKMKASQLSIAFSTLQQYGLQWIKYADEFQIRTIFRDQVAKLDPASLDLDDL